MEPAFNDGPRFNFRDDGGSAEKTPLANAFFQAVRGKSSLAQSNELARFWAEEAPDISTMFVAIEDRATMTAAEYARRSEIDPDFKKANAIEWQAPSQAAFQAGYVCIRHFLDGHVPPMVLEEAMGHMEEATSLMANCSDSMGVSKAYGDGTDLERLYKPMKPFFDLMHLNEALDYVREHTLEDGSVSLPKPKRQLLKALLVDGASTQPRVRALTP